MGVFGGIKDSKYSEGGVYLKPGVYRLQVIACKYLKTRTGKDAFVVELKVLESSNPERLPGSVCSWMVTLDKEPALGNIKQFLTMAIPAKEEQIEETVVEHVVSATNPLEGRIVRCSAVDIMTKRNTPYTKVKFFGDDDKAGAEKESASATPAVAA